MTIYVKHNDAVKSAIPYVKHNGEVKIPTSGWAKTGGELKQIWPPIASDGSVYIYNQATLEAFRDRVNNGETSLNALVIADITLTGVWTPIGNYNSNTSLSYSGTFDGGGHTITGLTISGSTFRGLFGRIASDGTVKNVKLASVSVTAHSYVGAIAGWNAGTVSGNTISGEVTATGISSYVGGIAGNNTGTVSGNTNTSTVTATSTSSYAGGIVGYNSQTVSSNTNTGNVTATGTSSYAGGIVGYNTSSGTVSGNANTGTVTGTNITSDA